jgi:hypothetical protein
MPYLLIRHKVQNYKNWKMAFDKHASVRKEQGCKGGKLYRSSQAGRLAGDDDESGSDRGTGFLFSGGIRIVSRLGNNLPEQVSIP